MIIKKHILISGLLAVLLAFSSPSFAHGDCDKERGEGMHELSDEQKSLLHETMKKSREKDGSLFQQMKKRQERAHSILEAETFDRKAFMNNALEMQKLHDRIMQDHLAAFASIASQFSPRERLAIAHHFKQHHKKWYDRNDRDHMYERHDRDRSSPQPADENAYPPYPKR